MKMVIFVLFGLFLVSFVSCKKEEEPVYEMIEYTVKGRITLTKGDYNFY